MSKVLEAVIFCRCGRKIGCFIDDHGHIARPDADSRRTAGIGTADVVLTAGDNRKIGQFKQALCVSLGARRRDHLNQSLVLTDLVEFRVDELQQHHTAAYALGRGRQDDCIAAFERIDHIVCRRGRRIGGGHHGTDYPKRAGDFGDTGCGIVGQDAECLCLRDIAHQAECLAMVFRDLVGNVSKARGLHGKFRQHPVPRRLHDGPGCCLCGAVVAGLAAMRLIVCLCRAGMSE